MKISITTECFYRLGIMLGLSLGNAYIGYELAGHAGWTGKYKYKSWFDVYLFNLSMRR